MEELKKGSELQELVGWIEILRHFGYHEAGSRKGKDPMGIYRTGNSYMVCSPFRNERTPSASFSESGVYRDNMHDFGDDSNHSKIDTIMHLGGMSYPDALDWLWDLAGCPDGYDVPAARRLRRDHVHESPEKKHYRPSWQDLKYIGFCLPKGYERVVSCDTYTVTTEYHSQDIFSYLSEQDLAGFVTYLAGSRAEKLMPLKDTKIGRRYIERCLRIYEEAVPFLPKEKQSQCRHSVWALRGKLEETQ